MEQTARRTAFEECPGCEGLMGPMEQSPLSELCQRCEIGYLAWSRDNWRATAARWQRRAEDLQEWIGLDEFRAAWLVERLQRAVDGLAQGRRLSRDSVDAIHDAITVLSSTRTEAEEG